VVLFVIAPILVFTVGQRFTKKYMSAKEKMFVHLSTLSLVAAIIVIILLVGWKTFLLIQIPILFIATGHGVWLFYVQHQFRHVVWTNSNNWDYKTVALKVVHYSNFRGYSTGLQGISDIIISTISVHVSLITILKNVMMKTVCFGI